ncbi:type II toxin-antitoxin system RelE/ParE family toxin [Pseudomonas syringae group sp. J248-6]|uniref:type II toxin-antitoxin system RelE/ParE family toxin n=1 Tax=Pseudomonas syringae group sp. J248-6 TaxID=3079590 RepID=UPI00290AF7FD|nr:type II toxin-antitoxin system RelE/ParE family toxin [Pseudomonas syringae group sp. J248-6]MDU8541743.1 type II toxin-antitoxin system RelE/ParE family toxin [Pseudomonas syringae group sp. J248-6]
MNLQQILSYIADRTVRAASELGMAIEVATLALPQHPYLYRHGLAPRTREIVVHPNYLVVYKLTDRIEVLAVLHARQVYPTDAG